MIKAIITGAGLGTRLLFATKEHPKEMLPIFAGNMNGRLLLKPVIQLIFEQLYDFGIRKLCFIVGRGKRSFEDHFTPDHQYLKFLEDTHRNDVASSLVSFYERLKHSAIFWINQHERLGFGHAVLQAQSFIGEEPFFVQAGDTHIISASNHLARLFEVHERYGADATLLLRKVEDPRDYGVAEVIEYPNGTFGITSVVEKPRIPVTNFAIMPIYIFKPSIFRAIEETKPGIRGEIELTDAIMRLIEWGHEVRATILLDGDIRLEIGTPENFWEALKLSYEYFRNEKIRLP